MTRWLVVIVVALIPAFAHADCAWLLWQRTTWFLIRETPPNVKEETSWNRPYAFKTFEQCVAAKQRVWAVLADADGANPAKSLDIKEVSKVPGELLIVNYKDGASREADVRCYPDSVDPRK